MMQEEHKNVINQLLKFEHKSIAKKLNLIEEDLLLISDALLYKAVGVIDYYSRSQDDKSKQIVTVLSSILYTYRQGHWDGLKQFLIIVLSRIGFTPSAIMVDEEFDFENNQFSSLDSIISQISTTINQVKNEVIINEKIFLLTDFQKEIWNKCLESKFIGVSAPTSAGKSYVILLKSIENILKTGGNIVYVVPTLSLITQVVNDYHQKIKEFGLNDYDILTSYDESENNNKIYVLTPERAISAYNEDEKPFGNVNTFIVDEIQNIERIENEKDERSKILFDSLVELSFSYNPNLIVFSGPRVSGLKDMGFDIFEEEKSVEIRTDSSPVTNFTYSIAKKGKKYFFNQYSQINNNYSSIEIKNTEVIKIGGKQYDDKYFAYLNTVVDLLGEGTKNVIFAPSSGMARKIAVNLSSKTNNIRNSNSKEIDGLIHYISSTVHRNYDLTKTLKNHIVYHHGKVPLHIRNVLEYSIKEKMIDNIVCTTTLMQGVNLPAQNVIMRNGYLSTSSRDGKMPKLTNYEISNLRGRAGRLLKDFIGRTFVLDENAFENKEDQNTLFQDENKSLKTGYGNIFEKYGEKVNESLFNNVSNESVEKDLGDDFHFLVTYIRNTVLKHKEKSYNRLNSVGIKYTQNEVADVYNELVNTLSVPLEICFKNRYVDPLILDEIYKNMDSFDLPLSISDSDFSNKLYNVVNSIRSKFPIFYRKYFGKKELPVNFFYTVYKWTKEKSLKDILSGSYYDNAENIDKTIDQIQKDVCFNLTALLKPFYSVKDKDSKLISCIEMGAYNPITLHLIKLNVPREVAITLKNTIFKGVLIKDNELTDKLVSQIIKENYNEINFWDRIQLKHLI